MVPFRHVTRRLRVGTAVVAVLAATLGAPSSTGAYFTAAKTVTSNQASAATLGAPLNFGVVSDNAGGNALSWSSATSQSWAQSNNVTSGLTYTVQRTLPGKSATTIYQGTNTSYADTATDPLRLQFTQVSAGQFHTAALAEDGSVWTWGDNSSGQLGTGSVDSSTTPTRVRLPLPANQVEVGNQYTIALLNDGSVMAWGVNDKGQLGVGTTTSALSPTRVAIPSDTYITSLGKLNTLSTSGFAIASDGTYWAWGYNYYGQLGVGDWADRLTPTHVNFPVKSIAAGQTHVVAIKSDNTIWAWGDGRRSQLGDGGTTSWTNTAVAVSMPGDVSPAGFMMVAAGSSFSLAEDNLGQLWIWGSMLDGVSPEYKTATKMGSGGFSSISGGRYSACAVHYDGYLKCWGENTSGLLMDGTTTSSATPVTGRQATGLGTTSVSVSDSNAFVVTRNSPSDGTNIWAWGRNNWGQRGDNSNFSNLKLTPTQVAGPKTCPTGTVFLGAKCTLPSGVAYSLSYTYAGWVSPNAEFTK